MCWSSAAAVYMFAHGLWIRMSRAAGVSECDHCGPLIIWHPNIAIERYVLSRIAFVRNNDWRDGPLTHGQSGYLLVGIYLISMVLSTVWKELPGSCNSAFMVHCCWRTKERPYYSSMYFVRVHVHFGYCLSVLCGKCEMARKFSPSHFYSHSPSFFRRQQICRKITSSDAHGAGQMHKQAHVGNGAAASPFHLHELCVHLHGALDILFHRFSTQKSEMSSHIAHIVI